KRGVMHKTERRITSILRFLILVFRLVLSAWRAEPSFVETLVDSFTPFRCAAARSTPPQLLNALLVKRVGRAHEDVVAAVLCVQPELCCHLLEIADNIIGLLLRRAPITRRSTLYVDAVLIRARQEEDL